MKLIFLSSFILILASDAECATTEQLRQWILANRRSMTGDSEGGDFASALLRLFGFGPEQRSTSTSSTTTTTTTTQQPTTTMLNMDVCPFSAEPLILNNGYAFCRPSSIGDCPVDYLCDQSSVLGRSICCRDVSKTHIVSPNRPPAANRVSSFNWNTVTPRPGETWKQAALQSTTRKTPWYIKDRTNWPALPNRPGQAGSKENIISSPQSTAAPSTFAPEVETTMTTITTTQERENPWGRLWTTSAPKNRVNVSVLQAGSVRPLKDGQIEAVGAITLLNDNGHVILVDTGSASDTERLLHSLSKEGVSLEDVNTVVITHGHPSHMGNMNFFSQKPILFHAMEYIGRHVTPTELKERPYRKLSPNVEVWKTPGHTQHDLTVLIHNVAGYGSMAIVGDLIPSEQMISEKRDVMSEEGVWDAAIKRQNANLIICMADWIVPGHGQPFRVLPHYRQKAGCTRLLAQRHLSSSVLLA